MDPPNDPNPTPTRSSTPASQQSSSILDATSNAQSSTQASTPPAMADSHSFSSMTPNQDSNNFKVPELPAAKSDVKEEEGGRERRRRSNVQTYNLKVLSGTAVHSPFTKNGVRKATRDRLPEHQKVRVPRVRRSTGNIIGASAINNLVKGPLSEAEVNKRPQTSDSASRESALRAIFGREVPKFLTQPPSLPSNPSRAQSTPSEDINDVDAVHDDNDDDDAHNEVEDDAEDEDEDVEESPKRAKKNKLTRRQSTRLLGVEVVPLAKQVLGKRSRAVFSKSIKSKRELLNLLDTKEYAGIDDKPVIHEVWSNGKLVVEEKPKKKQRASAAAAAPIDDMELVEEIAPVMKTKAKKVKKDWLEQGLYVGQTDNSRDWFGNMSEEEKRKMANMPAFKPTGLMPLPMWFGQRLLHAGRNFKLPYDICNPLAPGQPKPDGWKALISHRKNHLVGDAQQFWRDKYQNDDSKCICSKKDGCGEGCHNREMMYECDATNCNIGEDHCTNRSWAELEKRRDQKTSNIYTIGVEVFKTVDRGFGVRSNRCFEPGQIIVEYTGEIITEEECDRRMNEDYKDKDCYYLMSYEQNMILDATKGSIARFVNHSCNPNCNMVKWVVKGKPRIALFALNRQILTGEELTYDYNFNPFAANNVQECRCGSENCRGIVGPRPKVPQDKAKLELVKKAIKRAGGSTTKRKFKELMGQDSDDSEDDAPTQKKRKIAGPKALGKKMMAKTFAKSVAKRTTNAFKKLARGAASPSGRAQRALNKDSSRTIQASGSKDADDTSDSETSSTPAGPSQFVGKKGKTSNLTNSNGITSKDGKHKAKGWVHNRNKGKETRSTTSSPVKSPKLSSATNAKKQAKQNTKRTSRQVISRTVSPSRPSSSHTTSSHISHYPNVGEARQGRDEERDEFVSGTIRAIST